ncbi:MAG: hypothetical protein MUC95_07965 [Spirochaetes bacterium]|nr:hypothetical protein [Spirochaetota bacterium]
MVYIIGVDHLIQYDGPVPEKLRMEFEQYLVDTVRKYDITLIAEEFSIESLTDVYGAKECPARNAAEGCGIGHRFCDPEEKERLELGIPYYFDVKESVKEKYNIREKLIIDNDLRKRIEDETGNIVKSFWNIRERFWINKLADKLNENIIFICGHEHSGRLSYLLENMGIPNLILDPFWRSDIFGDYRNIGLK